MSVRDARAHDARAPARTRARGGKRPRKPFVAIDGEGLDIRGEHRYALMCASTGDSVCDLRGVPTYEALNFLLRQSRQEPRPILVGFATGYDINMFLRDLTREQLQELWTTTEVNVTFGSRDYHLLWIPSKMFTVTTEGAEATLYDVFGFFQSSFVKALKEWKIGSPDLIAQMKERRGKFVVEELPEIARYCFEECRLLVTLMDTMREALAHVGLVPRSWLGAGAIASALLSREKVHSHLPPAIIDDDGRRLPGIYARAPALKDAIMRAYFGGRTEVFRQGVFPQATSWDINSAYPTEAITLPSMLGEWRRTRTYDPDAEWAVWRVRWEVPDGTLVAPFPVRYKRRIYYPRKGEGYYHACEVRAAISVFGSAITVSSGYIFTPETDTKPFAFIPPIYAERQRLKAEGHASEKCLKLGLNSLYGKLAQGNSRDGRTPKFQDYYWAGRITAGTRARVFLAAASRPRSVCAVATDGLVFAGEQPDLSPGQGLGAWERKDYREFFIVQPGIYRAEETKARKVVRHSRGFFTREIRFPELKHEWLRVGPFASVRCKSVRFVGLGSALMRSDFSIWRTWNEHYRTMSMYLEPRKFYGDDDEDEPIRQLYPPDYVDVPLSEPYVPKYATMELSEDSEEWIAGLEQPLRGL